MSRPKSIQHSTTQAIRINALEDLFNTVKGGMAFYAVRLNRKEGAKIWWINLYLITDNTPHRITRKVAYALGIPYDEKKEALRIRRGCGRDSVREIIDRLSCKLFGESGYLKFEYLH